MIANLDIFPSPPEFMSPGAPFGTLKQALFYSAVAVFFAICVILVNDVRNRLQRLEQDRRLYYLEIFGFFGSLWLLDHMCVSQYVCTVFVLYTSGLLKVYGALIVSRALGLLVFCPYWKCEELSETARYAMEMFATLLSFAAIKLTKSSSKNSVFLKGQPIPLLARNEKGLLL